MDVSIAMCTCNGSRFLAEQLASLRQQTLPPCEIVICDDASTDATPAILQAFAADAGVPVRLLRNRHNLGSTANFAQAIALCRGQAIALCDQDDIWDRSKLERIALVLDRHPEVGAVFSQARLIDEHSRPLPGSLWQRVQCTPRIRARLESEHAARLLLERAAITGATLVFRSRFVPLLTPIPPAWVHDAWIALLIASQSRLCAIPEPLMSYRLHPAQQVGLQPRKWRSGLGVDRRTAMQTHQAAVDRCALMLAKLENLPVDPALLRLARQRLSFLMGRTSLRQQKLRSRFIGATVRLPQYFRFSKGLMSYGRDLAGV